MDTSIWEAWADRGQATAHQPHWWPSPLALSLIRAPARFCCLHLALPAMTAGTPKFAAILASRIPWAELTSLLLLSGPWAPSGMSSSDPRQPSLKWGLCPGANTLLPNIISSLSTIPPVSQYLEMSFPNSHGTKTPVKAEGRGTVARLLLTSDLVNVLEGQAQGFICGASRGQDGVQGLQKGHPTGVAFFALHLPAFEPRHLETEQQQHALSVPVLSTQR